MADELCPNCGSAGLRGLAFSCGSRPRIGKPGATESVGCLRRQRDALRAERDELRRMPDAVLALEEPVETALRTEIAALKAKLAKYTEPLTDEQARRACAIVARESGVYVADPAHEWDAAIRVARLEVR